MSDLHRGHLLPCYCCLKTHNKVVATTRNTLENIPKWQLPCNALLNPQNTVATTKQFLSNHPEHPVAVAWQHAKKHRKCPFNHPEHPNNQIATHLKALRTPKHAHRNTLPP